MDGAPGMATMKVFKIVFECLISTLMFTLFLCAQDKGTQWEISRGTDSITATLKSTNEPTTVLTLVSYTLHVTYPKSAIQMLKVYFDDEREGDELYVEPGLLMRKQNYYESGLQFEFDDGGKPMLAVLPICCAIGQRIVGDVDGRVVVEPVLDSRSNRHGPYALKWSNTLGLEFRASTLTAHNQKKDNFYKRTFLDRLASSKQMTISYKLESGASKHAKFDLNGTKDIIHQLAAGKEVVYLDAGGRDAYSIH